MNAGIVQRMIDHRGEAVTLRRVSGPSLFISVQVQAVLTQRAAQTGEAAGGVAQFQQQATISDREIAAAQWPGPPRRGDQIITGSARTITVTSVDTRKVGETAAMHVLQLAGAS